MFKFIKKEKKIKYKVYNIEDVGYLIFKIYNDNEQFYINKFKDRDEVIQFFREVKAVEDILSNSIDEDKILSKYVNGIMEDL